MRLWQFLYVLSILLIPVFALTQSHPSSQISPIDSNLNLGTYELFANVLHINGQRALSSDTANIFIGDLASGDGLRNIQLWAGDTNRLTIGTNGLIDARGNKITGVATPSSGSSDVATASWVEAKLASAGGTYSQLEERSAVNLYYDPNQRTFSKTKYDFTVTSPSPSYTGLLMVDIRASDMCTCSSAGYSQINVDVFDTVTKKQLDRYFYLYKSANGINTRLSDTKYIPVMMPGNGFSENVTSYGPLQFKIYADSNCGGGAPCATGFRIDVKEYRLKHV